MRTQLFETREIVAQLDKAQEERALTDDELALRSGLKRQSLGLASLARTIARHRSRIRFLEDGDANTNFFHLQACHRSRKNHIPAIHHEGQWFSADEAKQDLIYTYYHSILGTPFTWSHGLVLDGLLPRLDLTGIDACFTE